MLHSHTYYSTLVKIWNRIQCGIVDAARSYAVQCIRHYTAYRLVSTMRHGGISGRGSHRYEKAFQRRDS